MYLALTEMSCVRVAAAPRRREVTERYFVSVVLCGIFEYKEGRKQTNKQKEEESVSWSMVVLSAVQGGGVSGVDALGWVCARFSPPLPYI
jgi:hypothetical protein